MALINIPEMKPVPNGVTKEDRQKMYEDYIAELKRLNPHMYNSDGSQKSFWQYLFS